MEMFHASIWLLKVESSINGWKFFIECLEEELFISQLFLLRLVLGLAGFKYIKSNLLNSLLTVIVSSSSAICGTQPGCFALLVSRKQLNLKFGFCKLLVCSTSLSLLPYLQTSFMQFDFITLFYCLIRNKKSSIEPRTVVQELRDRQVHRPQKS